jgi:hypothetical protein
VRWRERELRNWRESEKTGWRHRRERKFMSTAKPLICLFAATTALASSAWAGGSGGSVTYSADQENPWQALAWHIHTRREIHNRAVRIAGAPVIFLGRAGGTFLHWPQILSETIEGDRALVNKRGVLGSRETPSEDTVYSPDE